MVATISSGTTARYYLSLTDYYVGGHEPKGRWLCVGIKAGVQVGGLVEPADFERLHAGILQNGKVMPTHSSKEKQNRVGGYDMTFSAPKSLSVVWALADDKTKRRIEHAQQQAVERAIAMLENNASFCRSGKGGTRRQKVRLTVALFQHGEARPAMHSDGRVFADPQLHHHAVILNIGEKATGDLGSLDGKALFYWKMAAGSVYHLELSRMVRDLGFAIGDVGHNGTFEVQGVAPSLRDYFSSRRHEIEDEFEGTGLVTGQAPALAAQVTRSTRGPKRESGVDRVALWRDRAASIGYAPDQVLSACEAAAQASRLEAENHDRSATGAHRFAEVLQQLTEHDSYFGRRHLHAGIAAALVGTGEAGDRVESYIESMLAERKIVALDRDVWGHEVLTTPEMLQIEQEIGASIHRMATRSGDAPQTVVVDGLIEGRNLNAEQVAAVRAATSGARVTVIEGAPGSGKTTTLAPIKEAWEAAGYRVIGSATAWRVANALEADLAIEARATDSWLEGARHGVPFLDNKTVLIVDEAALLSSRQMHKILMSFEAATPKDGKEGPRLVFAGDRNQLQSVGAGTGVGLVAAALPVQSVETIQRQRETWSREAIMAFGEGDAARALAAFADRHLIREAEGPAATVSGLVDAWQAGRENQLECLMVAKTNVAVRAISAEVRKRLRRRGEISGEDLVVGAVTPSGKAVSLSLAKGDRVRFLARFKLDGQGVVNGTEATIVDVDHRSSTEVRLTARVGNTEIAFGLAEILDRHGRAQMSHAYAMTVHGSQGLTTEAALVLVSPDMDRHDIYVAASRARGTTTLFVDRKAVELGIVADRPLSDRTSHGEITEGERQEFLANRLSRSGLKRTTLDVLLAAERRSLSSAVDPSLQEPKGDDQVDRSDRIERRTRSRPRGINL